MKGLPYTRAWRAPGYQVKRLQTGNDSESVFDHHWAQQMNWRSKATYNSIVYIIAELETIIIMITMEITMYKKGLKDQDNHDGVVTHLEPDVLECEVKWALGSKSTNKASGGDGIPAELFQILKDDAVKVLHSVCQQIWKTQQWPQDWKRSVFIPIPEKGNAKECSNYHTIALLSHASKVNAQNPSS